MNMTIFDFLFKKTAKSGYKAAGPDAIHKKYKFINVEFRTSTDGIHGLIDTQNPLIISNITHLFDDVQNEGQHTILKKFSMRLDSAEFEKLLKSFDASLIILEGTKL